MKPNFKMTTNIQHFLNDSGLVPDDLSEKTKNLVDMLGSLIAAVSANRELHLVGQHFKCQRIIERKKCRGELTAWVDQTSTNKAINWFCGECGEGGIVENWQKTIFDRSDVREQRELAYMQEGVWLEGQRLDELLMPLGEPFDSSRFRKFQAQEIKPQVLENGELRLNLPAYIVIELFFRGLLGECEEEISIQLGSGPAIKYQLYYIRYRQGLEDASADLYFAPHSTKVLANNFN